MLFWFTQFTVVWRSVANLYNFTIVFTPSAATSSYLLLVCYILPLVSYRLQFIAHRLLRENCHAKVSLYNKMPAVHEGHELLPRVLSFPMQFWAYSICFVHSLAFSNQAISVVQKMTKSAVWLCSDTQHPFLWILPWRDSSNQIEHYILHKMSTALCNLSISAPAKILHTKCGQ